MSEFRTLAPARIYAIKRGPKWVPFDEATPKEKAEAMRQSDRRGLALKKSLAFRDDDMWDEREQTILEARRALINRYHRKALKSYLGETNPLFRDLAEKAAELDDDLPTFPTSYWPK